jgi:hypothetical protein
MLQIRRPMAGLLIAGTLITMVIIAFAITLCLFVGQRGFHLTTVAFLTTGGPVLARIFESLVMRRQISLGLPRDGIPAVDETMIARTVPLLMPVAGGLFAFAIMA